MRHINEIIVHATATRPEWMAGNSTVEKRDEITRWHVEARGWSDIGYHMIIDRDGTRATGRPTFRIGAHVKGHNSNSLGVSLIGGFRWFG
jgi:N-acetylmuramoyl-L-alanine amidase